MHRATLTEEKGSKPVGDQPPLSAHVFVVAGHFPANLYTELAVFGTRSGQQGLLDAFVQQTRKKHKLSRKPEDQVSSHYLTAELGPGEEGQKQLAERLLAERNCGDRPVHFDVFTCVFGPLSEQVTALVAWASPREACPKCGEKNDPNFFACPHCGSARWGMAIFSGIIALICFGASIVGSFYLEDPVSRWLVKWPGLLTGAQFAWWTICLIAEARRVKKSHSGAPGVAKDSVSSRSGSPPAAKPGPATATGEVPTPLKNSLSDIRSHTVGLVPAKSGFLVYDGTSNAGVYVPQPEGAKVCIVEERGAPHLKSLRPRVVFETTVTGGTDVGAGFEDLIPILERVDKALRALKRSGKSDGLALVRYESRAPVPLSIFEILKLLRALRDDKKP